jgi:hypothetical protein
VSLQGEPVPGAPGLGLHEFFEAKMNDAGQIAFFGSISGGTGVFPATPLPPEVPLAPARALAALGAALAGLGSSRRAADDRSGCRSDQAARSANRLRSACSLFPTTPMSPSAQPRDLRIVSPSPRPRDV